MNDNRYASNYISNYGGTGGAEQMGIKYTDDNGEARRAWIYFYRDRGPGLTDADAEMYLKPLVQIGTVPGSTDMTGSLPSAYLVAKIPVLLYKDNKETVQISIQFEFNDEANDMFLGYKPI